MNKKQLIVISLLVLLIAVFSAFLVIRNRSNDRDASFEPEQQAIDPQDNVDQKPNDGENTPEPEETEKPAALEEVIEEFTSDQPEDEDPIDPDSFSEYVEDYSVEMQEDEVGGIF